MGDGVNWWGVLEGEMMIHDSVLGVGTQEGWHERWRDCHGVSWPKPMDLSL